MADDELMSDDEMDIDANPNLEEEYTLLHHVILPRVLPQNTSENLRQMEVEIIEYMQEIARKWTEADLVPQKTVELLKTLKRFHDEYKAQDISMAINKLGPNDNFAMFIHSQHCAIMIHVPPTERPNNVQNVIVATFPGNLDSSDIYRHESDIEFNYPERAINVKFSKMLRSNEFSNQLRVLKEGTPIGCKQLDCVSKWLLALLMDDESSVASDVDFPIITKKVRDEVWGNKEDFFRRSSVYMSVKAMLQHSLTLQLGAGVGKWLYKMFMLKFLIVACDPYMECTRFNIDLLSQVIAKLARRIEKLSTMMIGDNDAMTNMYNRTIDEAKQTIKTIRAKIDALFKKSHQKDGKSGKLPTLNGLDFEADIRWKMPNWDKFLKQQEEQEEQEQQTPDINNGFKPPACLSYDRYFKYAMPNPDSITKAKSATAHRIFWMDFERIVLYKMHIGDDHWSGEDIRTWSFEYAKYAEKNYKNNQLFISRMLLVRLKLIAILDEQATREYPLLEEHQCGVKTNLINWLLLPQSTDMHIAYELQTYFSKRDVGARDPSLVGEKEITEDSFSVKFAKESDDMKHIRDEILVIDKQNVEQKKNEWNEGREKAEKLRREANNFTCESVVYRGRTVHSQSCKKCSFKNLANEVCIKQYEHILPEEEIHQFAIVFELNIPDEIACLRDVLYSFVEFCSGEPKLLKIKCTWNDRQYLSQNNNSKSECVKLGSTIKQTVDSVRVLDSSLKKIIIANTSNCVFHGNKRAIPTMSTTHLIKRVCTLEAKDEYINLQWALNGTQHTENLVLASQSKCGTNMTLSEYKNFGSLRADGHRLQMRKLYAMIETEALSFEKESVLILVMQTLWECGVSGPSGFIRESHIDFRDPKFCDGMIEILAKFAEQQKNNWMHPFKLFTVTLVAIRAFEINDTQALANKIAKLLSRIRSIAIDWIDSIEKSIRDSANADETAERNLRLKLIYVAIIGGSTFFIHPNHKYYQSIFPNRAENQTAVESWLQFIIKLKNNIRMYTNAEDQLSSNLCMFLRLMESVGIYLERKVTQVIEQDSYFVFDLIKKQWPRSEFATFNNIYFDSEFPQILVVKTTLESNDQTVTIDIITGTFLVDSLPLSRLPSDVMHSETYRWFFENVVFEVQPDAQHNFSTVQKYNDCTYEFKMINESIVIIERQANGMEKQLIDRNIFNDDLPYYLVNRYSHWWNKTEQCIEFRQRTFGQKHFSKETTIDYKLNLINQHLIHLQTKRPLIDIKTVSYKKITEQLSRLEHPKYIHVLYYAEDDEANVELLRMNLKFKVKCPKRSKKHCELESNEFKGMNVIRTQKIGTLYGLKHGLILESKKDKKQIMLIPNGHVQFKIKDTDILTAVSINTKDDLRSPPFYQYQVDEFCYQLKSSNGSYASWFFLAYLHAVTSYGGIEPFTEMTGTERAIQILQSAFVWSSSPYDPEAGKILRDIAGLTPLRELKDDIQSVIWPKNIPKQSAQDCFVFIARKLLEDSLRLRSLHGEKTDKKFDHNTTVKIELKTDMKLNKRDHRRCQQLNPNLCVSSTFIKQKVLKTSTLSQIQSPFSDDTRTVCILYHLQQFKVPVNFNLKQFLMGKSEKLLSGLENSSRIEDLLNHGVHEDFRNLWISLYDAVIKHQLNREQYTTILSYYCHRNKDNISAVLALQAIATNPTAFQLIKPPEQNIFNISDGTFKAKDVSTLLRRHHHPPTQYKSKEWQQNGEKDRYDVKLDSMVDDITATIKNMWPCKSCNIVGRWTFEYIDFDRANIAINDRLKSWYVNNELNKFIKHVENRLLSLNGHRSIRVPACRPPRSIPINWSKFSIDFEAKIHKNAENYEPEIEEAKNVWNLNTTESRRSARDWWNIFKKIRKSDETLHLIQAGIFPRMVPSLLLPKILDTDYDNDWKCLIGSFAIAVTREQRQNRIQAYRQQPDLQAALEREEENEPYVNWSPREYPEWLLFEIEQNVTIRRIQVEIAKRMIDPPETDTKHSVMQLNMGEGKTAVIVPILAARLADGMQACQVIVLKSLFTRNLKSLRQYLGGLLNRRIYTFPCRRDMPIESHAHDILGIYKECKQEKGVILTLPEYRLSFQLKIYESISLQLKDGENGNFTTATNLLNMFKWTNENVRSILDESDAILHAKYQLIYTVGNQMQPDGSSQRWLVPQALLKRIPIHMKRLYAEFGQEKVEFANTFNDSDRTDVFTPCRILDENVYEKLKEALIDDLLAGRVDIDFPVIDDTKKPHLREILSKKSIQSNRFRTIEAFSEEKQNIIFILSGLLRFEVLKLTLTKRWRVNYGVDVKGQRKMAIPFKAKDVAAELTEFGHPDVAVCFTQMSYYYSGLTNAQLYHVFNLLENSPDAVNIYAKWISSIPNQLIDASIRSYSGVNLDDPDQRDRLLFPLFRFNMNLIDFWLSNVVYPHELKIFEKKLMCTAWDLCSEQLKYRVTGFSGTNDTKNILPITIAQNDLAELDNTNTEMRQILLDPRNMVYQNPTNITGKEILQELVKREITVLLDSGALMLELNNKEVAVEWLKLVQPQYHAAVYFDEHDILQTIDRNGLVTEFDYSVYRENLSNCIVYLDDVHTRGTDLRFPPDWAACVTLSGDITRDKTVQSCMRMRQLKTTQSILFWPSYEANIRLRELSEQRRVQSKHVMEFIEQNSRLFETANMAHWTAGALNYTKKLNGHKTYELPLEDTIDENPMESSKLIKLYNACVDDDFIKLRVMYGEKDENLLSAIAWDKFSKLARDNRENRETISKMQSSVVRTLESRAPQLKRFTHALDEEQEKELEQEIEEQIQIERPKEAQAAKPKFDERLKKLVIDGIIGGMLNELKNDGVLLSIIASLSNTQMSEFCESNKDAWAEHLLVTKDFTIVIENQSQACNDFLRPVCWVACIKDPDAKDILILLSSYECNYLMPAFRKSTNATLFMYRPRLTNLHSNLIHEAGLQVTGTTTTNHISVEDEVQIGVYAGLMYFGDEREQRAYCDFLGLIPRPWTCEQQDAFQDGTIEENGYVPFRKRNHTDAVSQCVSQCKFKSNPTDLAIKLIKAHHQVLPKDSHVASILNRGIKSFNENDTMDID